MLVFARGIRLQDDLRIADNDTGNDAGDWARFGDFVTPEGQDERKGRDFERDEESLVEATAGQSNAENTQV